MHDGSPSAYGCGLRLEMALSPHPTIKKQHRLVTNLHPTTGTLTLTKVVDRHNFLVNSSSRDDDLPLVGSDARVDLNPGGVRICYIQQSALLAELPHIVHHPTFCRGSGRERGMAKC
jgi:hypothetical protein